MSIPRQVTLDLRDRCKRCGKIPRGKTQQQEYNRNKPYCGYHCQQWAQLENAQAHINSIKVYG